MPVLNTLPSLELEFSGITAHGMVIATFTVCLPTSTNPGWTLPHGHTQISQVILEPIKLTVLTLRDWGHRRIAEGERRQMSGFFA